MADAKKKEEESVEGSIAKSIEDFIKEHWIWILVTILIFLIWKYNLIIATLAVAGTAFLGWVAWKFWVHYVQQDFISGIDFALLEIIPPREVLRSPKAMELFITNALYHWSMKGGKEQYWQGAVWFWFSLELVSIDGQVHFYLRTPTRVRSLIETQIYAQYPQAQVRVVEDYTLAVDEITPWSSWTGWGCEFALAKPEAYPIKTYTDFGLDKDPKEEYKIDPISPVIEFFGSLQKGEQMWMQIVVRPSKKEYHTAGTLFGHHDWVKEAGLEMEKLLAPYTRHHPPDEDQIIGAAQTFVPDKLKKTVEGMTAKTSKLGFDTGIRVMYVAKKEVFSMNNRKSLRLIFRQYANPNSNELVRLNSTQPDAYNTSYFMLSQKKVMFLANRMLHEFRERSFFHLPMRHRLFNAHVFEKGTWLLLMLVKQFWLPYFHPKTFVLNVEELATLWHFPGQILKVPTLERIESKEASPPSNLPT